MTLICRFFVTITCIEVFIFLEFFFFNFSVHNKRLPEDDVYASKHVAVLKETYIVDIYFAFGGQIY